MYVTIIKLYTNVFVNSSKYMCVNKIWTKSILIFKIFRQIKMLTPVKGPNCQKYINFDPSYVNINLYIKRYQNPSIYSQDVQYIQFWRQSRAITLLKTNKIQCRSRSSQYRCVYKTWSKSIHLFSKLETKTKFWSHPRAITLFPVSIPNNFSPASIPE